MVSTRFRRQVKYGCSVGIGAAERCCKLQRHNEVAPGLPTNRSELE